MADFVEIKQGNKSRNRRWFMSPDMDLILFLDKVGGVKEFQLCYDKNIHEQMLSWSAKSGYSHMAIDDGDTLGTLSHKRSPLVVPNGCYDLNNILQKFQTSINGLPHELVTFVSDKIEHHPEYREAQA